MFLHDFLQGKVKPVTGTIHNTGTNFQWKLLNCIEVVPDQGHKVSEGFVEDLQGKSDELKMF